jgi:hypothetical protein
MRKSIELFSIDSKLEESEVNSFLTSILLMIGKIHYGLLWDVSLDNDKTESDLSILSGMVIVKIVAASSDWGHKVLFRLEFFWNDIPELIFQKNGKNLIVSAKKNGELIVEKNINFDLERDVDKFMEISEVFWKKLQQNLCNLDYPFEKEI